MAMYYQGRVAMAQVLKQSMLGMLKKQESQSEWSGVNKTGIHRKQTIEVAEEEEAGKAVLAL